MNEAVNKSVNQQKINYQKRLDEIILKIQSGCGNSEIIKPSLLLHACCGPCSSYVLEYLAEFFQITVYYYNPNIYPEEEYNRRLNELKKFYEKFPPVLQQKVKLVEAEYEPEQFYEAIRIKENPELAKEKEKGERCRRCYELRLRRSFEYAQKNNFDYFCTTLSISPFKDAQKINVIGAELELAGAKDEISALENEISGAENSIQKKAASENSPKWLYSDFKKNNGFKRSLELSEEYGMYRQTYCGCIYSLQNLK